MGVGLSCLCFVYFSSFEKVLSDKRYFAFNPRITNDAIKVLWITS